MSSEAVCAKSDKREGFCPVSDLNGISPLMRKSLTSSFQEEARAGSLVEASHPHEARFQDKAKVGSLLESPSSEAAAAGNNMDLEAADTSPLPEAAVDPQASPEIAAAGTGTPMDTEDNEIVEPEKDRLWFYHNANNANGESCIVYRLASVDKTLVDNNNAKYYDTVLEKTPEEILEDMYDVGTIEGTFDRATGAWQPTGFPSNEDWHFGGVVFIRDFASDETNSKMIGNRLCFDPPANSQLLDPNVPFKDQNIKTGDVIYIYFKLTKNVQEVQEDEEDEESFVFTDKTSPVCPERLKELFLAVQGNVAKLLKTNTRFKKSTYNKRIGQLQKSHKKEKCFGKRIELRQRIKIQEDIRDKIPQEARKHILLLGDSECVHSLRFGSCLLDDRTETEAWQAQMWTSEQELTTIILEEKYVKTLLTPFALQKQCFLSDKFIPLRKYDRQQTVDETYFDIIVCVDENSYTLIDGQGREVCGVTDAWVRKNIPLETQTALSNFGRMYSVKIPECSSVKEGAPKIKYRNQDNQCLLKCLASALHHLRRPAGTNH
jgi:hypothetical protein